MKLTKQIKSPLIKSEDDRLSDEVWTERINSGNIEQWDLDHRIGYIFVDGMRMGLKEDNEKMERFEKIYATEKVNWPYGMGINTNKDLIPPELHTLLDECIDKSIDVARKYCQSSELMEEYFRNNMK